MSSHFAVLVSLALAIFLSPENLVVGLIVASDKKSRSRPPSRMPPAPLSG